VETPVPRPGADPYRRRAAFDLQWKVALGVRLEEAPFGKSTLCEFRALLMVHDEQQAIFRKSLKLARQRGYLKKQKKLKVALDTTAIFGRGAVKDTYNMLADGIALVGRRLALGAGETEAAWAERGGYQRYITEPSLKGALDIDWDNRQQRAQALASVVADADRLLAQVRQRRGELEEGSTGDAALATAAGVLSRVLAQDIERTEPVPVPPEELGPERNDKAGEPGPAGVAGAAQRLSRVLEQDVERTEHGPVLRKGVAPNRMPAIHDPQARHGRKTKSNRFVGHKAHIAVDTDEQLITAVAILPGNAPDAEQALALVEQTEANTGCEVEQTIADCAYGSGPTRQAFVDAGRSLTAKVPAMHNRLLSQNRLRLGPGEWRLHLPGGPGQRRPAGRPAAPLSVCQGCLSGLPVAPTVRARPERPNRSSTSPGGPHSTGAGVPAQPTLQRLSAPPSGG